MEKLPPGKNEFRLLFDKHKSRLFFYVYKMLNNDRMITEDIVQNVFIKLYENLGLIINHDFVAPWIYKTARNEIISYHRYKKRRVEFPAEDYENTGSDTLNTDYENIELREIIMSVLNEIPEEQKEVYLLKEYSGFSYREIAEMLDIDGDLVKSRLFHARKKLIEKVGVLIK